MTTFVGHVRRAVSVDRAARSLILAWALSPEAAAAAGVAAPEGEPRLEIEAPWPPDRTALLARIVSDDMVRELPLPGHSVQWITDAAASLLHLEVPGILHATLRLNCSAVEVLYSRNLLMPKLNIGGGRYEFQGAAPRNDQP
jgi:hypothetical protein